MQVLYGDDIDYRLIQALKTQFPGVRFGRTAPDAVTPPFVSIRRDGGVPPRNRLLDQSRMAILVYGDAETVTDLALDIQAFLDSHTDDVVRRVVCSGPADVGPAGNGVPARYMYADALLRRTVKTL